MIGRPLPPHLDALLGFVRRAWAPPAPTRRLTLQELAAGACVSSGYLSRVFRHHYGVGPVAAFELLRLGRAATLLTRSNLAVAAVARDAEGGLSGTVASLQGRLDELGGFVNSVCANWEGDEQAIYRGIQSRWDGAAAQVRDILDQIRATLGQTTESVETMRARVSQSLQG